MRFLIPYFIFFFFVKNLCAGPSITYDMSGGRFGDNIIAYMHAKWVSYYCQIPLIYKPFPYSSELMLDEKEINASQCQLFESSMRLGAFSEPCGVQSSTLFICPWFSEIEPGMKNDENYYFPINWKNKEFQTMLREMVSPKRSLQLTYPPSDKISIAIHLREGGGYDTGNYFHWMALKFPPLSYYVESLIKILDFFKGKQFYCHLFTDASNPKALVEQIQQCLPADAQVVFHFREKDNFHCVNVLEDFFSLFHFDILIRPQSHFSIAAACIQDYAIVCSPLSYSINDNIVTIEDVHVAIDNDLFEKCMKKDTNLSR